MVLTVTPRSAILLLLGLHLAACKPAPLSPDLSTPRLAVEEVAAPENAPLFFTPDAQAFVPGEKDELAKRAAEYAKVLQDPRAWRALNRQERFGALLLTGNPAQFRPLLDHLRAAPDWTLTWIDATSLIFQRSRSAQPWGEAQWDKLKERFSEFPKREQVLLGVQVAHRLLALQRFDEAKAILDETLKIDPKSTAALTELASLHGLRGQWEPALEAAEKAVKSDSSYLPAAAAEANALFAHGRFSEALQRTRRLVREQPEDGPSLYLHAKVTHAARAFHEEIVALQKIIAMSTESGLPTGTWRVYLGQAYGATGEGERSIEEFKLALKDPTLSESERTFATKAIERIESRDPIL